MGVYVGIVSKLPPWYHWRCRGERRRFEVSYGDCWGDALSIICVLLVWRIASQRFVISYHWDYHERGWVFNTRIHQIKTVKKPLSILPVNNNENRNQTHTSTTNLQIHNYRPTTAHCCTSFPPCYLLTASLSTFSTLTCCNGENPHYARHFSTR